MQKCTGEDPGTNFLDWVDVQCDRWWETTYTRVNWQYPPVSDGRLVALASGSRLLRIAYSSGRGFKTEERARLFPVRTINVDSSETSVSTPTLTPTSPSTPTNLTSSTPLTSPSSSPPKSTSLLPCLTSSSAPTSAPESSSSRHPKSHSYRYLREQSHSHHSKHHQKRYQWSKPPHYHASLLRSSLPRRRGRFRAILAPTGVVDFFRWEVTRPRSMTSSCTGSSSSGQHNPCRNDVRHRTDTHVSQALSVAESALAPYEACAGFFGWRGLGIEVPPGLGFHRGGGFDRQEGCASDHSDSLLRGRVGVDMGVIDDGGIEEMSGPTFLDIATPIDEEAVEQGRAQWAEVIVGLVGALGSLGGELSGEKENVDPPHVGGKGGKPVGGSTKPDSSSSLLDGPIRWDPNLRHDDTQTSQVTVSHHSSIESSTPSRPSNTRDPRPPSSNVPSMPSTSKAATTRPPNVVPAKLSDDASAKPKAIKDSSMPGGWWYPPPPPARVSSRFPLPPPPFAPWYGAAVAGLGHPRVVPQPHPYGWWYNVKSAPGPGPRTHGNVNGTTTTSASPTTWLSGDPDFMVKQNVAAGVSPSALRVCGTQSPNAPSCHNLPSDMKRSDGAFHSPQRGSIGASDGEAVGSSETDRGYESTTDTCTDSDPVPRTPTGTGDGPVLHFGFTAESKVVVAKRKDGDMAVTNIVDSASAKSSPVKSPSGKTLSLLTAGTPSNISSRSALTSPSMSTQPALVFPSLNGTFCQTPSASLPTVTRTQQPSVDVQKPSSIEMKDIPCISSPSSSFSSFSSSVATRQASLSPIPSQSPSPSLPSLSTSPTGSTGFRKDSQGFWEPVTPPMSPVGSSSAAVSPRSGSTRSTGSSRSENGSLGSPVSCVPTRSSVDSSAVALLSPTAAAASFTFPASPPQSPTVPSTSRHPSFTATEPLSAADLTPLQSHLASDVSNPTTLLPAFLASAVKRKRGSRTREIVDRLKLGGSEGSNEPSGTNSQMSFPELDWTNGVTAQSSSTAENDSPASSQTSTHTRSRSGSSARRSISGLCSELGPRSMSISVSEKAPGSSSTGPSSVPLSASRSDPVRKLTLNSLSMSDHNSPVVTKVNSQPKVSPTSPAENGRIELGSGVPNITGASPRGLSNAEWPKLGVIMPSKVTQPTVATTVMHPSTTQPHMSSVTSPAGTNTHLPPILPPPLLPQSMVHPQAPSQPLPPQMIGVPYFAYPQYGYPIGQFQGPAPPQGQMQGQGGWMAVYRPPQPPHSHIPHLHPPGPITGASGMRHVSW
ncbi:hypothetical protein F5I97DRAFT_1904025 [Phlebopus sp. FC_14]|nr:hypothetical protein F5I97DRAFT_1904025 [Phlebopus sp. FC_14]